MRLLERGGQGMLILGIHDATNSCAALTEGGRVVAVVQEERMTGVKNEAGFPYRSVKEVLRLAGRTLDEIDLVAVSGMHVGIPLNRDEMLRRFGEFSSPIGAVKRIARGTPLNDWYRRRCAAERERGLQRAG